MHIVLYSILLIEMVEQENIYTRVVLLKESHQCLIVRYCRSLFLNFIQIDSMPSFSLIKLTILVSLLEYFYDLSSDKKALQSLGIIEVGPRTVRHLLHDRLYFMSIARKIENVGNANPRLYPKEEALFQLRFDWHLNQI